ncbi:MULTISPECIES: glutamate--cysteine ligase [unclassified Rhodococcus (in: high G+C Gram-positive bacteria)]|uniref:carboxylate-amine ligase n=1 Tax=unclassified Rhodococcus (in: high G+C Gram-positive bacteria) TaxID=192944 RepID=UPI00163A4255|nr:MULTISPECIES: glutamate--cysteine ligase [unclassified Rhodococcus (in: high G+C Gram-positive bacteria)]MBC2644230.1 glutamate--cysteine ligase [Rhodococcus sp. 3A]MBC2891031.1 glutamate--cysteine ligase [Rhodococcus sp. 4CII]
MVSTEWVDPAPTRLDDYSILPTVGVEEEFVLIDPVTDAPFPGNAVVAAEGRALDVHLQLELSQCQIETATPVCTGTTQLRAELCRARGRAAAAATRVGARLLAAGVPPVGPAPRAISDVPRYRHLAEHFGLLGQQVICGCHVHVGVCDRDLAVQVSNHLRPWLPALLALTANSPIIGGVDTGYSSWRQVLWARWPSAGPPPVFESAAHYDAVVAELLAQQAILDPAMIYWDVRLSAHLPTVEVRVADVPATVEETVLLATLIRGLVSTALTDVRQGRSAAPVYGHRLRAGYWRAARDGMTGHAVDMRSGRLVPATEPIRHLLEHVRPALERTGDYRDTQRAVRTVLTCGNGAIRQRRAFAAGTTHDLVDMLARSTIGGCTPPSELN